MMDCIGGLYRTRSLENIKRLAVDSLRLVCDNLVIYEYDKNLFYYCAESVFTERRGRKVLTLSNPNKKDVRGRKKKEGKKDGKDKRDVNGVE